NTVNDGITALRHTKNIKSRALDAAAEFKKVIKAASDYAALASEMARIKMGGVDVSKFFETIYPAPKARKSRKDASPVNLANNAAVLNRMLDDATDQNDVMSDLLAGDKATKEEATARQQKAHAKLLDTLMDIWHLPRNAGDHGETLWTAFNAVTDQVDHARS